MAALSEQEFRVKSDEALESARRALLPLADSDGFEVELQNGVLNLVAEKRMAIAEIARILKPGGRLQIADIVLGVELPEDARQDIDLWTG